MVILKQIEEVQAIGTLAHTPAFWQRIGVFVNSPIGNPASCRLQCVRYCVSPYRCHHGSTGLIVQPFLLVFAEVQNSGIGPVSSQSHGGRHAHAPARIVDAVRPTPIGDLRLQCPCPLHFGKGKERRPVFAHQVSDADGV